jgi:hypothetical protein
VRTEGLGKLKTLFTSSGLEPATFVPVAESVCLQYPSHAYRRVFQDVRKAKYRLLAAQTELRMEGFCLLINFFCWDTRVKTRVTFLSFTFPFVEIAFLDSGLFRMSNAAAVIVGGGGEYRFENLSPYFLSDHVL